jgi:hypothetical protein
MGVRRIVAAVDENDSFLGDDYTARRISLVGGLDVNPLFDLRESWTEVLSLNKKGIAQER